MGDQDRCAVCGLPLRIGEMPCITRVRPHEPMAGTVIDDQIEGGARFFENLGHEPVWIETKSQLRGELAARQLEPMVKWAGPSDQHLKPWTGVDLATMEQWAREHWPDARETGD